MIIITSDEMFDLDGKTNIKDGDNKNMTTGKIIARMLSTDRASADPLRSFLLAEKFYTAKDKLELDVSDVDFIKKTIKDDRNYFPLVRGKLLQIIENSKQTK